MLGKLDNRTDSMSKIQILLENISLSLLNSRLLIISSPEIKKDIHIS